MVVFVKITSRSQIDLFKKKDREQKKKISRSQIDFLKKVSWAKKDIIEESNRFV